MNATSNFCTFVTKTRKKTFTSHGHQRQRKKGEREIERERVKKREQHGFLFVLISGIEWFSMKLLKDNVIGANIFFLSFCTYYQRMNSHHYGSRCSPFSSIYCAIVAHCIFSLVLYSFTFHKWFAIDDFKTTLFAFCVLRVWMFDEIETQIVYFQCLGIFHRASLANLLQHVSCMFDTNDISNITIRANIQLLWLLLLKTKIALRFGVRCCFGSSLRCKSTQRLNPIQTELMVLCDFSVFYVPISLYVCICLCSSFYLLIFCTICLVGFFHWQTETNWIDFSFVRICSLLPFVSFVKNISRKNFGRFPTSIVMTTHNSSYIIVSLSEWLETLLFFHQMGAFLLSRLGSLSFFVYLFFTELLMNKSIEWC